MNNTKLITLGGLMAAVAVLFQSAPVVFSEFFTIFTMFSVLPIYTISRISPWTGFCAYFTSAFILCLISAHEGILFLCTNGIIGLSLGSAYSLTGKKAISIFFAAVVLTISISLVTHIIGIPVLGFRIQENLMAELAIYLGFSLVYNTIALFILEGFYSKCIKKFIR